MSTRGRAPLGHRAVSVRLADGSLDPLALGGTEGLLFADGSRAMAGRGVAAAFDLPSGLEDAAALHAVSRWLADVRHAERSDLAGAAVRAFGALPFDRSAPGRLVVPELTVGRDGRGGCWATVVAADPAVRLEGLADELDAWARRPATAQPDGPGPSVRALPEPEDYARAVGQALSLMEDGPIKKVVLARCLEASFAHPLEVGAALARLHDQEPSCTVFSFPSEGPHGGRFCGASPELLVRRRGERVDCQPLAGTVGLGAIGNGRDAAAVEEVIARFLASAKDRLEHELVVEAVVEALAPRCAELEVPDAPSLVRLRSVAHLGTRVEGTLRAGRDGRLPSVLELLADLHPTPAVGGVPRKDALALIEDLEPAPRGRWAGPVGWVDADGDGEWVIGIRSATVDGRRAVLTAGAGIVTGSDPRAELDETTVKLTPVLEALWPGAARLLQL